MINEIKWTILLICTGIPAIIINPYTDDMNMFLKMLSCFTSGINIAMLGVTLRDKEDGKDGDKEKSSA